jgi:hypothetical protein
MSDALTKKAGTLADFETQALSSERAVKPALAWILLLAMVFALIWSSMYLAAMRIYQVDECMEVYVASVLKTGQNTASAGHVTLLQIILSWILPSGAASVDLFASARLFMLLVFWLNWMLIASATGARPLSRRWLIALVGAATLVPLWDYGFEIRHDNLLLTGLLLTWGIVRFRPPGRGSFFLVGALMVVLEFIAFKAFVYTLPLAVVILVFPPPGRTEPRWKLTLAWTTGALASLCAIYVIFRMAGLWDLYVGGFNFLSTASQGGHRFAPWTTLGRLLSQTPLLLALVVSALAAVAVDLARRGASALSWEGELPEALLFLGVLAALMINPAPFPYNLLHLVPYALLLSFRYGCLFVERISSRPGWIPLVAAILLFTHFVPFGMAVRRHLDWPHTQQEALMSLAEKLTDPVKDPVYDAIGMVPTRPIVDQRAFLHSLNFKSFMEGPGPKVRDLLAAQPAAVFIPSYRTDWLPDEDHAFIRGRYVALADDFWVLGKVLPAGGGTFEIVHAGRYRVSSLQGSDLMGTYPTGFEALLAPREEEGRLACSVDGRLSSGGVVELAVGEHRIETAADCQAAVVWVGPRVDRIHRLSQKDHRRLFFNWY